MRSFETLCVVLILGREVEYFLPTSFFCVQDAFVLKVNSEFKVTVVPVTTSEYLERSCFSDVNEFLLASGMATLHTMMRVAKTA